MERENIINLYDVYKDVLKEKERNYFEYYYYEDYSLTEISSLYDVSKAYAGKFINNIEHKLMDFEQSLKIKERNDKIKLILENIDDKKLKEKIEDLL